jgi:hypothetical protein
MPPSAEPLLYSASASSTVRGGVELDWLTQKVRCVRGSVSRRAMRASGDSPSHLSAQPHLLATYLRLMVSFRGMLLTLQSGLERLTPQAHRVPVYPTVFPHSDMSLHGARSKRCKQSGAVHGSARICAWMSDLPSAAVWEPHDTWPSSPLVLGDDPIWCDEPASWDGLITSQFLRTLLARHAPPLLVSLRLRRCIRGHEVDRSTMIASCLAASCCW